MKIVLITIIAYILLPIGNYAKIRCVATYGYAGDLVKHLGGEKVKVDVLARGNRDPHFIVPRPSLISLLRRADLLIINGGQLEIGWLPPLINRSGNPSINFNSNGFLNLFSLIKPIEVPHSISRAHGDIHPDGNPHFHLDPVNIKLLANGISMKLTELNPQNSEYYKSRLENFIKKWNSRLEQWRAKMAPLKNSGVILYHKLFNYFLKSFDIRHIGTLESAPGIPPNPKHIKNLIQKSKTHSPKVILQDVYHNRKAGTYVSKKCQIPLLILPHDVGAMKGIDSIFQLFDEIVNRIHGCLK